MRKLILTKGLPASGKSIWAREQVKTNNAIRFNKDDIRKELGLVNGTKAQEKVVYETERARVANHMDDVTTNYPERDHLIIVDNTHLGLNNKHVEFYKKLAESTGFEFEIKFFDTPYEECIYRDSLRVNHGVLPVGWQVIKKMKALLDSESAPPKHPVLTEYTTDTLYDYCVIIDIDGTLAFSEHRNPFDFDKVKDDRCNEPLADMISILATGDMGTQRLNKIIVSGRDDSCIEESKDWLNNNNIDYDEIYFRKTGDKRKDSIVKREIYNEHIKGKYNVLAVFDDRNQVVDMWREEGLPTYQVWYGDF